MGKTNTGLVEYAKAQLGKPYWYGTFGQISTTSLYNYKKKQYPDQYQWACPSSQLGVRVHDCIGLIKGYLWSNTRRVIRGIDKNCLNIGVHHLIKFTEVDFKILGICRNNL